MRLIYLRLCCFIAALGLCAGARAVNLVEKGQSAYVIVGDAADAAVQDLQTYLQRLSGATLPIVPAAVEPLPAKAIVVGNREVPGYTPPALSEQGFHLKMVDGRLVIHGGGAPGTQFGVYGLLEDHLNCHWLTDSFEVIPPTPTVTLPDTLDDKQEPSIRDRDWIGGDFGMYSKQGPAWRRRNRVGQSLTGGASHNMYTWLPPKTYYAAHPEWYPLNAKGARLENDSAMCLCWTNTAMIAELARVLDDYMDKHPATALIPVCQGDGYTACQCEKCRTYAQQHGGDAALLINCLNQVLAITRQAHPQHKIVTFAYHGTFAPPTDLQIDPNLYVEFVRTGDAMKSITSPSNEKMRQMILGWAALTPNLRVWSWSVGFHCFVNPFPNYRAMAEDVKWFAPRVKGFRHQGGTYPGADWGEMRAWMDARLLWNAALDVEKLEQQFCTLYCGQAAGAHLWAYLQRVQRRAEEIAQPFNAVFDGDPDKVKAALFPPEQMAGDLTELNAALAAANGVELEHVKHLYTAGFAHLRYMPPAQVNFTTYRNERWLLPNGDSTFADSTQGLADLLRTVLYKEWSSPMQSRHVFLRKIAGGKVSPEVENGQVKLGFCANLQGGLFSFVDKVSGRELLGIGEPGDASNGGLRDYTAWTVDDHVFSVSRTDDVQTVASSANVVANNWVYIELLKQKRQVQLPDNRRGFTVSTALRAAPAVDIYNSTGYTSKEAVYSPITKMRWTVWAPDTAKLVVVGQNLVYEFALKGSKEQTIPLPDGPAAGQLSAYLINKPGDIVTRMRTDWSNLVSMVYSFDQARNGLLGTWTGPKKQAVINEDVPMNAYEVDVLSAQQADREMPVTGMAATAGDGQINLAWDARAFPQFGGYLVYRATQAGGPYTRLTAAPISKPVYTDAGSANGTRYYYTVRVVDTESGEGPRSAEISATAGSAKQ